MTDYIRKAVELADGFEVVADNLAISGLRLLPCDPDNPHQVFLDALAAQLVRQICAISKYDVIISKDGTEVFSGGHVKGIEYDIETISMSRSDDMTMNTIKAIVDSKVLE